MKISINKLAKILDGEIIGNEKVTLYNLSKIEDANFAEETSLLTKAQILQQASTAMLAQANKGKQGMLQLIQSM